jgi:protein-arginine kinase activator protein McsA
MIDRDSERAVAGWVRLGDTVVGRKTEEGRCDQCGRTVEVSKDDGRQLCARCFLEGETAS